METWALANKTWMCHSSANIFNQENKQDKKNTLHISSVIIHNPFYFRKKIKFLIKESQPSDKRGISRKFDIVLYNQIT